VSVLKLLYYTGDRNKGYGVIKDLAAGAKIQLKKLATTDYTLVKSLNLVGGSALDTLIATKAGDIIGSLPDNTSLITSMNSTFFSYV